MHEGIRFLLGFIVVLFLLWYVGNQIQGSLANRPPSNNSSSHTDTKNTSGYTEPEELPTSTQDIGKELQRIESDTSRIQKLLDEARAKAEASVYQNTIVLRGSGRARDSKVANEYLTLDYQKSSKQQQSKVLITGWEVLSSVTNKNAFIGKGVYLPYSGQVNAEEAIFISPGDRVIINSGRSPIGVSFRTNKCTGYFEQFQDFSPSLARQCPQPEDEPSLPAPPNQLDDRCLNYLEGLSRCTMPLGQLPLNLSPECGQYLRTEINYNKCVEHHKSDRDFYQPEWRIFLGRDTELFKDQREVIKVLDLDKKVIDSVSY